MEVFIVRRLSERGITEDLFRDKGDRPRTDIGGDGTVISSGTPDGMDTVAMRTILSHMV